MSKTSGSLLAKFQGLFKNDEQVNAFNEEIQQLRADKTQAELNFGQAQKRIGELEAENTDLVGKVATLTQERNEWKAKAEAYGSQPGVMPTEPISSPKADGSPRESLPSYYDPNAEHNRGASEAMG